MSLFSGKGAISVLLTTIVTGALALTAGEIVVRAVGSTDDHGTFILRGRRILPYRFSSDAYRRDPQRENAGYDSILGWVLPPRFDERRRPRPGDPDVTRLNIGGVEFRAGPLRDRLRIVLVGDSYTYGGVEPLDSWGHVLEERLNEVGVSAEVINLGVGGYGIDQAYLRWTLHGRALAPDILIFGFQPENIKRNVNIFRPFYTLPPAGSGVLYTKPRFVLLGDRLVLKNAPTMSSDEVADFVDRFENHPLAAYEVFRNPEYESQRFWMHSRLLASAWTLWRARVLGLEDYPDSLYFSGGTEAYNLGVALIDELGRDARSHRAEFFVLHLPRARQDVIRYAQGEPSAYVELLTEVKRRHAVIDPFDLLVSAVREGRPTDLHMPDGHYSPAANRIVGELVAEQLVGRFPVCTTGAPGCTDRRRPSGR